MILGTMSRKPKAGYYVRGEFVAEGSEADLAYKRELKGFDGPSRTELKRESDELQALGESLVTLRADLLERLGLSEKFIDALAEAKRITNFEGKRRQMQFIGKLTRKLDEATVAAARAALDEQHRGSAQDTLALHQAEQWRDRLRDDDAALEEWMRSYPLTDSQALRALIRQTRKDAAAQPKTHAGEAPRQGRAYRELFQLVREQMQRIPDPEPDSGPGASTLL